MHTHTHPTRPLTTTINQPPPPPPSLQSPINTAHAARLALALHAHLDRARRRLLPRLRLALRLPATDTTNTTTGSSSSYDLISDVLLAFRSLEASASAAEEGEGSNGGSSTIIPVTAYSPWAKALACVPAWAPLLALPTAAVSHFFYHSF